MLLFIWQEFLFQPLLNLLIGLYNTIGLHNLGLAIIWLTIIVRIILLPFSLIDEKRRKKQSDLKTELSALQKSYGNNPTVLREEQRKLFRQYRFRRWPKIFSLIVQGLILLILYKVFIGGIKLEAIVDSLYSFVDVPVTINSLFFGIDIGQRNLFLSSVTGLLLLFSIYVEFKQSDKTLSSKDLLYFLGYPLFTILILWYLPSVKAIFISLSILFTDSLRFITSFFSIIKKQQKTIDEEKKGKIAKMNSGIPHPKSRFK